ncbi:MAG TPA: hypothetical protein VGU46_04285 [Acidobacteriaceae bacterium]|nr:hypothetical protein [Acidobacteriaceae bacterium]
MRISKRWAILTPALLLALQFAAPAPAHADTYQITDLGKDSGRAFYGMDDSNNVVFSVDPTSCSNSASSCYSVFGTSGFSSTAPSLNWDSVSGKCSGLQSTCSVTDNGHTASITANPAGHQDLWASNGSDPAQLLFTSGFGAIFAINGVGDIVFNDGLQDEWYEAISLTQLATFNYAVSPTTAPEPASFLLLTTGILAPLLILRRRKTAPANL